MGLETDVVSQLLLGGKKGKIKTPRRKRKQLKLAQAIESFT